MYNQLQRYNQFVAVPCPDSNMESIAHEMSAKSSSDDADSLTTDKCCANCDKVEIDDIKLKPCDKCDLVKYCNDECQEEHREVHDGSYKRCAEEFACMTTTNTNNVENVLDDMHKKLQFLKAALEFLRREEILFKQPESSYLGDCPICCLPIPFQGDRHTMFNCCCKIICAGCVLANLYLSQKDPSKSRCPFCRKVIMRNDDVEIESLQEGMKANDSAATFYLAHAFFKRGDYSNAVKHLSKSAEMGYAGAHCNLAFMYTKGYGVEKDEEKRMFHLEEAAIGGNPEARFRIGLDDLKNEKYERGVKHLIIAANQGHDQALQALKGLYTRGVVSKVDFAAALRAHHAAVCAMKSDHREKAMRILQSQPHK